MTKPFTSYLASHDGQRGAVIEWPQDCQQAFDKGVTCAQAWLCNDDTGWLWANLIIERDALPAAVQRRASLARACAPGRDLSMKRPSAASTSASATLELLGNWPGRDAAAVTSPSGATRPKNGRTGRVMDSHSRATR